MNKRVTKVLIGKNIARTASLDIEGTGFNLKDGEIFLATGTFQPFSAEDGTVEYDDTNIIYIGQGTDEGLSYSTPNGTAVTGVNRILWSDAIDGARVRNYNGTSYTAATQEVATVSGAFTPTIGVDYVLRLVFTHLREMPGQFTHTYRVTAESTSSDDLYGKFVTKINAHDVRRVQATFASNTLTLTAREPIPSASDSLLNIDEFYFVNFEVFMHSPSFDGTGVTIAYTATPSLGQGDWRQVRDMEKLTQHDQRGNYDNTAFPVLTAPFRTVKGATYDTIVIEHAVAFTAPTNETVTEPKTTLVYIPAGAAQGGTIQTALNGWMASTPGGFANISI